MNYERKQIHNYMYLVTEHYRDGVLFATTEQKRIHDLADSPSTIDGRQRKLKAFCGYVKSGRHDMACYIYRIT